MPETPSNWHAMEPGRAAEILNTDPAAGLTSAEAAARLARIGRNALKEEKPKSLLAMLAGPRTSTLYPDPLRRFGYYAADIDKRFVFLTNNFLLPALTIARLYKRRWQVELFFKWIKQYLRIKAFYGTSVNAVKTQVWIAVCVYVLVAIVKKELRIERGLGEILQILSISLFEKTRLLQAFSHECTAFNESENHNQLPLFDF